jgi:ERCC4-related helicase
MTASRPEYVAHPLVWPATVEARRYQQTIVAQAWQRNTMVILPTALGKTVIAALAAAQFLHCHWDMKVLVMAPTRPLVVQHREAFRSVLRLKAEQVAVLTGKVPPSYRRHLWACGKKVYFATPQVVQNDLKRGRLCLADFGLVVFDECHRARGRYAYTFVAAQYLQEARWPVILGTTASPGSNPQTIRQLCRTLAIEEIAFRTEDDPDVAPYIHRVDVEWRQVELPNEYRQMQTLLQRILWKRLRRLQASGVLRKKLRYVGRRDLLIAGERLRRGLREVSDAQKGPIFGAIMLQAAALTAFHALGLLETQGIHSLRLFLERVEQHRQEKKSYRNIVNDPDYAKLREYLTQNGELNHPKIAALKREVGTHLRNHQAPRILVFTQYRDTASHLVAELSTLSHVRAARFVGQASKEADPGLSQEAQAEMLAAFRDGRVNVLVATSIAEEGLDIPAVDLVIFYEPIPSGIRYIQRKGRTGRRSMGKTVILAAKETADIAYLYASKRRVTKMKQVVAQLNTQIGPLARRGVKPALSSMPRSALAEEKPSIESPEVVEEIEAAAVKRFTRTVNQAARDLWMNVMKAGANGLSIEDLQEDSALGEYPPSVLAAAIARLEEANQAQRVASDRLRSVASMSPREGGPRRDLYEVEVEKILPGRAVCRINDRWRARLVPEEYDGPLSLMKKHMRFRARGHLYHEGATLCLRVRGVTEILETP